MRICYADSFFRSGFRLALKASASQIRIRAILSSRDCARAADLMLALSRRECREAGRRLELSGIPSKLQLHQRHRHRRQLPPLLSQLLASGLAPLQDAEQRGEIAVEVGIQDIIEKRPELVLNLPLLAGMPSCQFPFSSMAIITPSADPDESSKGRNYRPVRACCAERKSQRLGGNQP